jgi:hypothetical protein
MVRDEDLHLFTIIFRKKSKTDVVTQTPEEQFFPPPDHQDSALPLIGLKGTLDHLRDDLATITDHGAGGGDDAVPPVIFVTQTTPVSIFVTNPTQPDQETTPRQTTQAPTRKFTKTTSRRPSTTVQQTTSELLEFTTAASTTKRSVTTAFSQAAPFQVKFLKLFRPLSHFVFASNLSSQDSQ